MPNRTVPCSGKAPLASAGVSLWLMYMTGCSLPFEYWDKTAPKPVPEKVSSVQETFSGSFFYQVCKRASHIGKIRDEALVISCQPQEGTHLCFGAGLRETLDRTYFFFLGQHQTSPHAETMYRASVRPMWNLWGSPALSNVVSTSRKQLRCYSQPSEWFTTSSR